MNLRFICYSLIIIFIISGLHIPTTQATSHGQALINYSVVPSFYQNRLVFYYVFNNGTRVLNNGAEVVVVDQYRLVDSNRQPIEGQYDIIPTGGAFTATYSDLREIVEINVPDGYIANTFTSVEMLTEADLLTESNIHRTGITVNAPLAWPNSQLQGRDRNLITLWEGGNPIFAFDFGVTPAQTAPIYKLIAGFDEAGNPIELGHEISTVVKQMHTDPGYSDFWQVFFVTVPSDTPPNSIRSYDQIVDAGYPIQPTSTVINCPAIPLDFLTVGYYDDIAYHITQIDRPDIPIAEDLPPAYVYAYDTDEDRLWVLSANHDDETYSGFCQQVTVTNSTDLFTNAAAILNNTQITLTPQEKVTTCAVLHEVLPDE